MSLGLGESTVTAILQEPSKARALGNCVRAMEWL